MNRLNLGLYFNVCNKPGCNPFPPKPLKKCGACKTAVYCCVDHQREDWPRHKSTCTLIKKTAAELVKEEAALRAHQPGETDERGMPANPFEDPECIGRFWWLKNTQSYMQARHNCMSTLLNMRTGESVEAALDHAREMLRLCRGDNLGVRGQVPSLLLRMGRDQEAYDFIKWWVTRPKDYDFGDNTQPYLNLQGEDALEPLNDNWRWESSLSFPVEMTQLKLRLLLDVKNLADEMKKKKGKMTDEEKKAYVEEEAASNIMLSRPDLIYQDDYTETLKKLEAQVEQGYQLVKKRNKHFWPAILTPEMFSHRYPGPYTPGSPEEAVLAFRESWYAWAENETVIAAMRNRISEGDKAGYVHRWV